MNFEAYLCACSKKIFKFGQEFSLFPAHSLGKNLSNSQNPLPINYYL